VLVRDVGFAIVDFEGDATRSIADRRQRRSPLDDVSSMLRSFARAADVGLAAWTERHAEHAGRLTVWAGAWKAAVQDLFLRSYLEVADPAWFPDVDRGDRLLRRHLGRETED
jgi:maltose alpha-D-glucosyltransferase/alpha-amylase